MNERTLLERVGAIAGIVFFVLILVTFFTPGTPAPDAAVGDVQQSINDNRTLHLLNVYLNLLATIAFMFFLAALWRRLRQQEGEFGGASVVALAGGVAVVAVVLVQYGAYLALIYGASEEAAVSALSALASTTFIGIPFAMAIMLLGVAASALATRAVPAWLSWAGVVISALFVVGALGIFDASEEGGPLGILLFVGILGFFLWVLAASVVLLRGIGPVVGRAGRRGPTPSPTAQPT